ncbi:hypothetical protein H0H92_003680 [Tricholoma furcatifolium]|nr:hypothetical protein H0H92_003680 [Tricholoma furcatifolium]
MKLFAPLSALAFAAMAMAQGNQISLPAAGAKIKGGSNTVVRFQRFNGPTYLQEVGIAIAFLSCGSSPCDQSLDRLGTVLYAGSYNPTAHGAGGTYEDFTVTIPDTKGPAQLGIGHYFVVGVSYLQSPPGLKLQADGDDISNVGWTLICLEFL